MLNILKRELSLRKNSLMVFMFLILFLAILDTSIYPSIQTQAAKLISSLGSVYKDVGVEGRVSFSSLEGYISLEMFAVTWPIIMTLFTTSQSGASLAGEIEKGSLGMLISQPLGRAKIYLVKYLFGLTAIIAFIIATIVPIIMIGSLMNMPFQVSHFLTMAILCFLLAATVFSLGLMLSAIFNQKSRQYGIVGAAMLIMYVINAVAGLKPTFSFLQYGSLFHYFNVSSALSANHIPVMSWVVFIALSVVGTLIGSMVFNKRDISI